MQPEAALLLHVLNPEGAAVPAAAVDVERLVALIQRHRVVGLILASKSASKIPQPALARLQIIQQSNVQRSLYLAAQLGRVVELLEKNRIAAIAFKGPLLSLQAYGNIATRSTGDIDLLLDRDNLARARELLLARGFAPIFPTTTDAQAAYLFSLRGRKLDRYLRTHAEHHLAQGPVNLDLHWSIVLKSYALEIREGSFWKNATRTRLGNVTIRTLAPEDLLLVLCINAAKEGWTALGRLCDVAAIWSQLDGVARDGFLARARRCGARRMVLLTLMLSNRLLKMDMANLKGDSALTSLAEAIAGRFFERDAALSRLEEVLLLCRVRDNARGVLRYLFWQALPTVGDQASINLPWGLDMAHVFLRPFRIALKLFQRTELRPGSRPSGSASRRAA